MRHDIRTFIRQLLIVHFEEVYVHVTVPVAISVGTLPCFVGCEYLSPSGILSHPGSCVLHQLYPSPVSLLHVLEYDVLVLLSRVFAVCLKSRINISHGTLVDHSHRRPKANS